MNKSHQRSEILEFDLNIVENLKLSLPQIFSISRRNSAFHQDFKSKLLTLANKSFEIGQSTFYQPVAPQKNPIRIRHFMELDLRWYSAFVSSIDEFIDKLCALPPTASVNHTHDSFSTTSHCQLLKPRAMLKRRLSASSSLSVDITPDDAESESEQPVDGSANLMTESPQFPPSSSFESWPISLRHPQFHNRESLPSAFKHSQFDENEVAASDLEEVGIEQKFDEEAADFSQEFGSALLPLAFHQTTFLDDSLISSTSSALSSQPQPSQSLSLSLSGRSNEGDVDVNNELDETEEASQPKFSDGCAVYEVERICAVAVEIKKKVKVPVLCLFFASQLLFCNSLCNWFFCLRSFRKFGIKSNGKDSLGNKALGKSVRRANRSHHDY
jgi:hypothetical protein